MENIADTAETVTISRTEYESLKQQISWLIEQLKLSRRRQFGVSSEKSDYSQLNFFDSSDPNLFDEAEDNSDNSDKEPDIEEVKAYRRKKARTSADRLPPDLPVEIIEHQLSDDEQTCPECGGHLHVMGHEVREELKLIPAKAVIIRHIRNIYACRDCEKNAQSVPIVKAPMPEPVIKGSFASPEAVAHIAVQKFVMGVPLYRQEQEWDRNGVKLSRQTMSNWLIKSAEDWLKPIYDRLHEFLCDGGVAHADETTVQVLREPGKTAQSKSYMWLYRTSGDAERPADAGTAFPSAAGAEHITGGDSEHQTGGNAKHPIVLYEYQPSRSGDHPAEFLKNFKGFLHTDGWSAYHSGLPGSITVVGCWAHVRRKFDEALMATPEKDRIGSEALHGKHLCDQLFSLERNFSELPADDNFNARYSARIERSKPLMDDFFAWAGKSRALPKTLLGRAVKYALDQRRWLENVLLDGRLELSNNRAERSIKPFVIGRKNWLFNNTPKGATASAMIYSIIETAKENGLNPYEYLTYIFRAAPNLLDKNQVDDLLPWNMSRQD